MKKIAILAVTFAALAGTAATARPFHHHHPVCSFYHHHRVCR
jgi:hypothetical protein